MNIVHPVADEWGEDYAVFSASAEHVVLTQPLAAFLDYAVTERLRPVLVSGLDSRLSSFVALAMRRAGGLWAVQGMDGATYDGLSGYRIDAFRDMWERPGQGTERLASFRSLSPDPRAVLMFDVFAHQRAASDTSVGQLSASLVTSLGGAPLDVWGPFEPLLDRWDTRILTDTARREMPASDVMHARSADGSYVDLFVGRTRRGILEQAKGGVPIGAYPQTLSGVVQTASTTLATLAEDFQPTIGFVSLAEVDGVTHTVSADRGGVIDAKLPAKLAPGWQSITMSVEPSCRPSIISSHVPRVEAGWISTVIWPSEASLTSSAKRIEASCRASVSLPA